MVNRLDGSNVCGEYHVRASVHARGECVRASVAWARPTAAPPPASRDLPQPLPTKAFTDFTDSKKIRYGFYGQANQASYAFQEAVEASTALLVSQGVLPVTRESPLPLLGMPPSHPPPPPLPPLPSPSHTHTLRRRCRRGSRPRTPAPPRAIPTQGRPSIIST